MFDRIAHRYDLLNHLLSLGQDIRWRRRLARSLKGRQPERVLDLATGTGDQLLSLAAACPGLKSGIGMDISHGMLIHGRDKVAAYGGQAALGLVQGDAQALPLADESVDAVTISFGIRNVADPELGLREMWRVLRPGGRALILEFGLPGIPVLRGMYLWYFRRVLPWLGGMISGDPAAYQYLNRTVETFAYGETFVRMMQSAGFVDTQAVPMTLGVVYLYEGAKPR